MGWADQVDLSRFLVAVAPYGGPTGTHLGLLFEVVSILSSKISKIRNSSLE